MTCSDFSCFDVTGFLEKSNGKNSGNNDQLFSKEWYIISSQKFSYQKNSAISYRADYLPET